MVTTKRGNKEEGGTKVSYSGSVAWLIARKMDTMKMRRGGAMLLCKVLGMRIDGDLIRMAIHFNWSTNRADWFTDRRFFDSNGNPLYDTDWQDEATPYSGLS